MHPWFIGHFYCIWRQPIVQRWNINLFVYLYLNVLYDLLYKILLYILKKKYWLSCVWKSRGCTIETHGNARCFLESDSCMPGIFMNKKITWDKESWCLMTRSFLKLTAGEGASHLFPQIPLTRDRRRSCWSGNILGNKLPNHFIFEVK